MVINGTTTIQIMANGGDITGKLEKYFKSISISDKKGIESDSMTMTLADPRGELAEPETLRKLTFIINGIDKGTFEVNDLSGDIHTGDIDISGTAFTMASSIKNKRSRSIEPLSIGELVDLVAVEHGFKSVVSDSLSSVLLPHINQVKESDLNLLTRIAKDKSAFFKVTHDRVIFTTRDEAKKSDGELLPVMQISDPKLTTGRWSVKRREKVGSVKASWLNEETNLTEFESYGNGSPVKEMEGTYKAKGEAISAAKSEFKRTEKADRSLSISMPLDVRYVAGCNAIVSNHSDSVNGEWEIESFNHTVSVDGYDLTSIEMVKGAS